MLCSISANAQVSFNIDDASVGCNDDFCVSIDVSNFDSVLTFQFGLEWDTSNMSYVSYSSLIPPTVQEDTSLTEDGQFGFSWVSGTTLPLTLVDGSPILELCFTPLGGTDSITFTNLPTGNGPLEVGGYLNGAFTILPSTFTGAEINISDMTPPTISCPNDTTIMGGAQQIGNLTPVTSDDCSNNVNLSYVLSVGGTQISTGQGDVSNLFFNPGTTTVTYTATDESGNSNTCAFDVTVDNTPTPAGLLEYIPKMVIDCDNNTAQLCLLVNEFDSISSHRMGVQWDTSVLSFVSSVRDLDGIGTFNTNIFPDIALYNWAPFPNQPPSTSLPDSAKILTVNFNITDDLPNTPLVVLTDFATSQVEVVRNLTDLLVRDVDYVIQPEHRTTLDNSGPIFESTCDDITQDTDNNSCNALVTINIPTISDACSGVDSITYTINGIAALVPNSVSSIGATFDIGTTTVTFTAYDGNGNTSTCDFDVTINDINTPAFDTACADINENTTGNNCDVNLTIPVPSVNNACVGVDSMTYTTNGNTTLISGNTFDETFTIGTSAVTITAHLGDNTTLTCNFNVFITDTSVPTFDNGCTNIALGTDQDNCTSDVTIPVPTISGACSGLDSIGYTINGNTTIIANGATDITENFEIGTTSVTWTAFATNGNDINCNLEVTVSDNQTPSISCPADMVIDAPIGQTTVSGLTLTPTINENCPGATVTYSTSNGDTGNDDASGLSFDVNTTTTITYTVTDAAGLSSTCSFDVTINETIAPSELEFAPTINVDCSTDTVVYCLNVNGFNDILRFQMGIKYDTAALEFVSAVKEVPGGGGNPNPGLSPEHVWFAWSRTTPFSLPDDTKMLTITFTLKGQISNPLTMIEDIGSGLEVVVENGIGEMILGVDYFIRPEVQTNTADTAGPDFSNCENITVSNDPGACGADVTIPVNLTDFCSGVASASYIIGGGASNAIDLSQSGFMENFPVGTTSVTITATDGIGNTSNCMIDVTVNDEEAPEITCPSLDVFPSAAGTCVASVPATDIQPQNFTDNCSVTSVNYTITGALTDSGTGLVQPQDFPIGESIITYTISDAAGNSTTCDITVEVRNAEVPMITCPMDYDTIIPMSDTITAINFPAPIGIDNCNDELTFTYEVNGIVFPVTDSIFITFFPVGTTTVIGTVTNSFGTSETCTFDVTVINSGPEDLISCPDNLIACSNIVNGIDPVFNVAESDVIVTHRLENNGNIINGNGTASGLTFQPGTTIVTYFAAGLGTTDECSFIVTLDDVPPVIDNCPTDITLFAAADSCGATAFWPTPTATDDCGILAFTPNANSGDFFEIGTTSVTYAAADSSGNQAACNFNVIVLDTIAPTITDCPAADFQVSDLAVGCGVTATWSDPTVEDNCSGFNITTSHASGDTFYVTTTITVTVTDASNNVSSCSFEVVVNNGDDLPPVIENCPSDTILYAATDHCGAVHSWTPPTITDDCSEAFLGTPTFMPGDTFPVGQTIVGYVGFDAQGNQAVCNFSIEVRDTTAPVLTCPATVLAFSTGENCGTVVNSFDLPTAIDNCDDNIVVICSHNPGDFFNVGTTTVTCRAIDNNNNQDSCIFNVIVEDQVTPVINCPDDIVVNLDGTVVSGTTGIVESMVTNATCDSVMLTLNVPEGSDNCPVGMPEQVGGPANGSMVAIGTTNTFRFVLSDGVNTSDTCSFDVTVNPLSEISIMENGDGSYCVGDVFSLSVTPIAGASYTWTLPDGSTQDGAVLELTDITADNQGTYTVECLIGGNCGATSTIDINDIGTPPTFDAGATDLVCNSSVQLFFTLDPASSNVDSLRWIGPNGFTSTVAEPIVDNPVSGDYTVIAYNGSCASSETFDIASVMLPEVEIFSDCGGESICIGDQCSLIGTTVTTPGMTYNWAVSDDCGLILSSDENIATITGQSAGSCEVMYWLSQEGCSSDTTTITITTIGEPIANNDVVNINNETTEISFNVLSNDSIASGVTPEVTATSQPPNGTLTYNGDGIFTFGVGSGFNNIGQFQYEVCYDCQGSSLCSTAIVTIEVQDTSCTVPTLITPNNDGFNDELVISCLSGEDFPDAEMIIFNQWGDEVYRRKPYGNNVWWDGTYNGNPVTDGTYYYIFKRTEDGTAEKGYITVYR